MNPPADGSRPSNLLPALVSGAVALFAGIFALGAGVGLTGSWRTGLIIAAVTTAGVAWLAWRRPPLPLDRGATSRALLVLSGMATAAALIQNARLAVFMIAPTAAGYSAVPSSDWEVRHSCLSAYFVAAQAADKGANVYDSGLYSLPVDKPGCWQR
jgi:hypothetical protein